MKSTIYPLFIALLTLSAPPLIGQSADDLKVVVSTGRYLPTGDLGYGRSNTDGPDSPDMLNLDPGLALGLTAEVPLYKAIGIRGGIRAGLGSELDSKDSCGCPRGYEETRLSGAAALLLSGDLVVNANVFEWPVSPYAVGGLAFRRHFYDDEGIPEGRATVQAEEQSSRWVPHLGVGLGVPLRSFVLRVEAEVFGDMEMDGLVPRGGRYADAFVTLGVSW